MTAPGRTALFIHGLWLHAASWGPCGQRCVAAARARRSRSPGEG